MMTYLIMILLLLATQLVAFNNIAGFFGDRLVNLAPSMVSARNTDIVKAETYEMTLMAHYSEPESDHTKLMTSTKNLLLRVIGLSAVFTNTNICYAKGDIIKSDGLYVDLKNKYSINIPPSFTIAPKKVQAPKMLEYTSEESLVTATSFAEGSSLSVTRSNAPLLLKDFQMDWWFSPLETLKDVGNPSLVATLLILQRQGEFKKKETTSEILDARFDRTSLNFEFVTPLAPKVQRKTIAKSIFRDNQLYTIWISALTSVFDDDGGYGSTLYETRESFKLIG